MKTLRHILALCALSLVIAPAALAAGGSAGTGYGGGGGNVQQQVGQQAGQSQGTLASTGSKGSLPFTGLDLGLLVAGGAVLLVVGASIRRAARRSP
jgi:hypothetical protein